MSIKIGQIYKGLMNNKLFKIVDIKNENGRDYIVCEVLNAQKSELKEVATQNETFQKLSLNKESD